jgi:hypothetical protein
VAVQDLLEIRGKLGQLVQVAKQELLARLELLVNLVELAPLVKLVKLDPQEKQVTLGCREVQERRG